MALSAESRKILQRIHSIGRQVGATPKEIKAAIETGIVESGLRNLPGGDADSAGWRQERASLYKDPTNLDASIRRFFDETRRVRGKYGRAGDLAAAVQRPAAQYRGRYQQVSGQAQKLMEQLGGGGSGGQRSQAQAATVAPQVDTGAQRQAILSQYLSQRGRPGALAALGGGLTDLANQPAPVAPTAPQQRPAETKSGAFAGNAVSWARQKIGNPETGTNEGGLASYANQRFGMRNQPWCAMFTSLAVTKGGAPKEARTASVAEVLRKAQSGQGYHRGFISANRAKPGDLIAFGTRHIGMVDEVRNGKIIMIAGNDSNRVNRRAVAITGDTRIVRPKYGARAR